MDGNRAGGTNDDQTITTGKLDKSNRKLTHLEQNDGLGLKPKQEEGKRGPGQQA